MPLSGLGRTWRAREDFLKGSTLRMKQAGRKVHREECSKQRRQRKWRL